MDTFYIVSVDELDRTLYAGRHTELAGTANARRARSVLRHAIEQCAVTSPGEYIVARPDGEYLNAATFRVEVPAAKLVVV